MTKKKDEKQENIEEVNSPIKAGLKTKEDIVNNWLPRYTGRPLEEFGEYILLTNFSNYVKLFSQMHGDAPIMGEDKPMQTCTADGITIINFGMGSPVAATVMDLLTAIHPKAVLFLGKTGVLKKKIDVGELILPIAAIREKGLPMIICHLRYHHYLPLLYRKPFPQQLGTTPVIIGPELSIPPTAAYGSMTSNLRNT